MPARAADVAVTCAQADCFEPEDAGLRLVWRWGDLVSGAHCADLRCGPPLETADRVMQFMADGAYD